MSIKAEEKPLSFIFGKDYEFIVPGYQRPYSWGKEEAEQLFDDIYDAFRENRDEYFLGSIVLIKKENERRSEIIDGQQRLTTLTILISCLYSQLPDSTKKDEKIKETLGKYIKDDENIFEKIAANYRLKLREKDNDFFIKYIQNFSINELLLLPNNSLKTNAQENIKANASILISKINKYPSEIINFITYLISKCFLVVVTTPGSSSAMRIFSVMNTRGLDLKPNDIIKSEVLSMVLSENQDELSEKWEDYEEMVGRDNFSLMFSHINMIHKKDKMRSSLVDEFQENVLKKYSDKKLFIEQTLKSYSENYNNLIKNNYQSSQFRDKIKSSLDWLNRIPNKDWMPPALFYMHKFKLNGDEKLSSFLFSLERLSSYLLFTSANTNDRISRYSSILEKIENGEIENVFQKLYLSDEEKVEFVNYLNGDIYTSSSISKRYLILRLDQFISDRAANYDPNVLTIEHVLPQTIEEGSEWSRWWPDLEERDRWVHKIGNLLPLNRRRNSAAKNYEFERKKSAYFSGNNNISSYALTTQVISELIWTPEVVERRQNSLISILKERWSL